MQRCSFFLSRAPVNANSILNACNKSLWVPRRCAHWFCYIWTIFFIFRCLKTHLSSKLLEVLCNRKMDFSPICWIKSKWVYGIPLLYATSFMSFTAAQLQFVDNPHRLYRRVSHFIQTWVHESKSYCCIIFSAYICNPMQNKLSSFLTILYLLQGH